MQKAIEAAARQGERCRLAMNVAQAAAEAGLGRDALYAGIRSGQLEARKLGRRTIITRDALQRFLETLPALKLPADQQERAA